MFVVTHHTGANSIKLCSCSVIRWLTIPLEQMHSGDWNSQLYITSCKFFVRMCSAMENAATVNWSAAIPVVTLHSCGSGSTLCFCGIKKTTHHNCLCGLLWFLMLHVHRAKLIARSSVNITSESPSWSRKHPNYLQQAPVVEWAHSFAYDSLSQCVTHAFL